MAEETVLNNFNLVTFKTEKGFQNHIDEIGEFDLVLTPDRSLKGTLLDFKWADHLLNDMSWLRADTFSWQSGDVYVAAYNHLAADFEGTTAETETVGNIEITFYRAEDKHKICLPDQEDKILALYNSTGVAWYYILDTANKQFKLPRSKHNKYADTVPVVGNGMTMAFTNGSVERVISTSAGSSDYVDGMWGANGVGQNVSTSNLGISGTNGTWGLTTNAQHSGIIAKQTQDTDQYKYLYFYVGNFEKEAIEQTAGIAAEMFNGKADVSRVEVLEGYDYVVESQLPTEANGYTWYRKYKSGWVEQGGVFTAKTGGITFSIVYPIQMLDTNYCALLGETDNGSNNQYIQLRFLNKTTTGASIYANLVGTHINSWQVSGIAQ